MRAVTQEAYGPPEDMRVARIDRPQAGEGEVLVRVCAAGIERGTWHLVTGRPYLVRLAGYGIRRPKTPVAGTEVAGRVEEVGPGVERFAAGDEVFGCCQGAFAEFACVDADELARKPPNLSFEQAATMPVSGLTALQALRDGAGVRRGQSVLVLGASGGVGTFAVQIAKVLGAEVTGVCSAAKRDLVRSLGADHVVDYAGGALDALGERFDVILDLAGNRSLGRLRRWLAKAGTLVIVGGEGGGRVLGGTDRQLRALVLSRVVGQRLRPFMSRTRAEDLEELARLAAEGYVTPVVDRTYALDEAAVAVEDLVDGRLRGKAALVP